MQANWSLILNVLLLIGVIVAIARLMKARKQSLSPDRYQPSLGQTEKSSNEAPLYNDDIIAVRKVSTEHSQETQMDTESVLQVQKKPIVQSTQPQLIVDEVREAEPVIIREATHATPSTVMMFLLAKENRQFAGYELLQTVLAAGLRFGEGHLFHRHQYANGQGSVLCSLAAATSSGVFDLQNIGAFSVRGLCLFMQTSKDPGIDEERFSVMLETAKQLSEGMDAYLLDDKRQPLTDEKIATYHRLLNIEHLVEDELTTA